MAFKYLHKYIFKAFVAANFVNVTIRNQITALNDSYFVAKFFRHIQNVSGEKDGA